MEYSHPYFFIIIMVRVGSIPIMIAVRSNLSRLILTGAWLDVAYFEDELLFLFKTKILDTYINKRWKLLTYIQIIRNLHWEMSGVGFVCLVQ